MKLRLSSRNELRVLTLCMTPNVRHAFRPRHAPQRDISRLQRFMSFQFIDWRQLSFHRRKRCTPALFDAHCSEAFPERPPSLIFMIPPYHDTRCRRDLLVLLPSKFQDYHFRNYISLQEADSGEPFKARYFSSIFTTSFHWLYFSRFLRWLLKCSRARMPRHISTASVPILAFMKMRAMFAEIALSAELVIARLPL